MANKKTVNEKMQSVFIPRENKHDDALFVAVNGQRILVRKGEVVKLPERFAKVINNSFEAARQAESYISSVSSDK